MHPHYLEPLFSPRTVALVGASDRPGSLGHDVFKNLLAGALHGEAIPINPKHDQVLGERCYRSLVALDKKVDLAVVATPAATVPAVLEDAAKAGTHHAVILAAGFGETGAEGKAREAALGAQARRLGIRLLGPNCLGHHASEDRVECHLRPYRCATRPDRSGVAIRSGMHGLDRLGVGGGIRIFERGIDGRRD